MTGEGSLFDVPPAAIGRYRVQHPLGAGTCGPVFRCESPEGDAVAVKLLTLPIRPERIPEVLEGLRRLVADGAAVAGTVLPVDTGLHEDNTPYLATSLAPGDSLDVALRRFGPAMLADVLPRLSTLAAALDQLASVHVHHGALHPRDVIVDETSTLMTGVGVWQALATGGVRLPRRSPYRAPELADLAVSAAGDQFSLAAVAYEWITGRRAPAAFVAGDMSASVGTRREALGAVFARAMHLDPGHRFPTCRAFVEALQRLDLGQGDQSEPVAPLEGRARRRTRPSVEALPLLSLDVAPSTATEMPLQLMSDSADGAPEPDDRDLPLHTDGAVDVAIVPAMPMAEAASEYVDVPSPGVTGGSGINDDAGAVRIDDSVHEPLPAAEIPAPPAPPVPRRGRRYESPGSVAALASSRPSGLPASSSSPVRTPWGARFVLLATGMALGLAVGYWVWGRAGVPVGAGQDAVVGVATDAVVTSGPAEPSLGPPASGSTGRINVPPASVGGATEAAPPSGRGSATRAAATPADGRPSAAAEASESRSASRTRPDSAAATAARRGSVRVTTRPAGAMVMLDGKLVGKSPMTVRNVAPGRHSMEFRRQGHRPVTLPVQVEAGTSARVSATLPRAQEPR